MGRPREPTCPRNSTRIPLKLHQGWTNECIKAPSSNQQPPSHSSQQSSEQTHKCLKHPPSPPLLHNPTPQPCLNNYRPTTLGHPFNTLTEHQPHNWLGDPN